MWIVIAILAYVLYQIYRLESAKGQRHWFSVDVINAVEKHKKFGELTGIKTASEGKDFKGWSKEDHEKWDKFSATISNHIGNSNVYITYLASEMAYFVNNYSGYHSIIFRDDTKPSTFNTSNLLYSAIVIGDENGFKPHIKFLLYERYIKTTKGKHEWVLTPCLQYRKNFISIKKEDYSFDILCDLPMFKFKKEKKDKELKSLGFEIKRNTDVGTDPFGGWHGSQEVTYKKNGTEIRCVY